MSPRLKEWLELRRKSPGKFWRVRAYGRKGSVSLENEGAFDELVVGDWIHLEQMDKRVWWMRLGDREFDIVIPRDPKKPVQVKEREQ